MIQDVSQDVPGVAPWVDIRNDNEAMRIKRLTAQISGLPALPAIAAQLIEAVDDPKSTAQSLANLVSSDPALAARLLKLANSAYYGFPRTVGTAHQAVVLLGFEVVRDLCLSVLITDCFFVSDNDIPLNMEAFWNHALTSAVCCRMIMRATRGKTPGEGFIAGLVHDIGKLLLAKYFPNEYRQLLKEVQIEKQPLLEAEM
ncbi:MAG: HDOD domain-containing protein, partial [bacterium]